MAHFAGHVVVVDPFFRQLHRVVNQVIQHVVKMQLAAFLVPIIPVTPELQDEVAVTVTRMILV